MFLGCSWVSACVCPSVRSHGRAFYSHDVLQINGQNFIKLWLLVYLRQLRKELGFLKVGRSSSRSLQGQMCQTQGLRCGGRRQLHRRLGIEISFSFFFNLWFLVAHLKYYNRIVSYLVRRRGGTQAVWVAKIVKTRDWDLPRADKTLQSCLDRIRRHYTPAESDVTQTQYRRHSIIYTTNRFGWIWRLVYGNRIMKPISKECRYRNSRILELMLNTPKL